MLCCGKDRSGNFCEDCGKRLTDTTVATLMQHLRNQINSAKSQIRKSDRDAGNEYYFKQGERAKKNLIVREAWLKWVSDRKFTPPATDKLSEEAG